jgi:hypothetical protein
VDRKSSAKDVAAWRARRRALGLRSTETILHENEIAELDRLKEKFGLASRSDAIRVLIAKMDIETITSADVAALNQSAG